MVRTLNGIRALLFLFIFGAHFKYVIIYSELGKKFFEFFNLARFAVLFFVLLSGFCIALGYSEVFKELSKKLYLNFVKKRFIRVYPLYFITGLIALLFVYLPQGIKWLYHFILVYAPMISPWFGIEAMENAAAWFICVIFSCYIITPIFLFLFHKKEKLTFHISFCIVNYLILAVISAILVVLDDSNNEFLYRFPLIRMFEYLIALDLGYLFVKYSIKDKIQHKLFDNYAFKSLIDFSYIVIFFLIMYILPNDLLIRHVVGIPVICSFLVYLCVEKRSILYDIFSSKICNFFGNISFECYMFHWIIMLFLTKYSKKFLYTVPDIITLYIVMLVVTILVSIIYKEIVEIIKSKYLYKSDKY